MTSLSVDYTLLNNTPIYAYSVSFLINLLKTILRKSNSSIAISYLQKTNKPNKKIVYSIYKVSPSLSNS